jgi:phosphoenolpyruvate---glycerone phosphotransferase subunit DhaM
VTAPEHSAVVVFPVMLHARPAALIAREVAEHDAVVTIDGAKAASILDLMKLGVIAGQSVRVVAKGTDAAQALDAVVKTIDAGLGPAPGARRHGTV